MKPTNTKLYDKVKKEARSKFKVWPSAYASGWLVKEYKRRGGKYTGGSRSKRKNGSLSRWYREKWIDVCQLPRKVSCGRKRSSRKNYPYCRPSVRVSSSTPRLASTYSKQELKRRCSRKRRKPSRRIL